MKPENINLFTTLYSLLIPVLIFFALGKFKKLSDVANAEGKGEYKYFDSLRGIAATLVFIHHSIMIYNFHTTGKFGPVGVFTFEHPIYRSLYVYFGQASVMIFFMITGFLFFGKILSSPDDFDVRKFFHSRIRRLLPAAASCFIVYITTLYLLTNSAWEISILKSFIAWMSFGFISLPNAGTAVPGWVLSAGVFWTLVVEWKFYILLPFISFFIRGKKSAFLLIAILSYYIFYQYNSKLINEQWAIVYTCFILGFLAALIRKCIAPYAILSNPLSAAVAVLYLVYIFNENFIAYKLPVATSLFFIFVLISYNNSFFGLLKIKPLFYAGKSSYSIYIVHAPVLNIVCGYVLKGWSYSSCFLLSATILCCISFINYAYVERRFMNGFSKKISSQMQTRQP